MNIKPCPFCGGTNIEVVDGSMFLWCKAQCQECEACAGEVHIAYLGPGTRGDREVEAVKDAIEAWNRRAGEAEDSP